MKSDMHQVCNTCCGNCTACCWCIIFEDFRQQITCTGIQTWTACFKDLLCVKRDAKFAWFICIPFFVKSGSMTTDDLMFDAMGNRIPDDSWSGILDIFHYDPIWNWHWNSPSRLYVLTLLIVSGPAGEKKSFNFMRAKSESLGSAA